MGYALALKVSTFLLLLVFTSSFVNADSNGKIKVFFDQDVLAGSSNILSLVMLLQHPDVEVVGVGVVAGDSNIADAVYHTLHAVELCGRPDVPVAVGAAVPYVNNKGAVRGRLNMWGPKGGDGWLGEFGDFAPSDGFIRKIPGTPDPLVKPVAESAAELFVKLARKYPGELVLVTAGPLTNIALAVSIAPDIVQDIKAVYVMAAAQFVRSKFNFWWDAESAAVFLRQPWANKFLVPIDVCQLTNFTREIHDRSLPTGKEARRWLEVMFNQEWAVMHLPMWDELTVAIMLDHSIITEEDDLYVDVDYNAGPNYGGTLWWSQADVDAQGYPAAWEGLDVEPWRVVRKVDVEKFYDLYSATMTQKGAKLGTPLTPRRGVIKPPTPSPPAVKKLDGDKKSVEQEEL